MDNPGPHAWMSLPDPTTSHSVSYLQLKILLSFLLMGGGLQISHVGQQTCELSSRWTW